MSNANRCRDCPRVTRERRKLWNPLRWFIWRRLRCDVDGEFVGRDATCHVAGDQLRAVAADAKAKAQTQDEGG